MHDIEAAPESKEDRRQHGEQNQRVPAERGVKHARRDAGDTKHGSVRKIQDAGNAIDQRQAECEERIEAADQNAANRNLRQNVKRHAAASYAAIAMSGTARSVSLWLARPSRSPAPFRPAFGSYKRPLS